MHGVAGGEQASDGAVLFVPGRRCEGFPLVLRGCVKVSKTSPGGREIVLYRVEPGEGCVIDSTRIPRVNFFCVRSL